MLRFIWRPEMHSLYSLKNLQLDYGGSMALCIDSLEISANRVTVVEGENGSGKTSLMKVLNCLVPPSAGSIGYGDLERYDEVKRQVRDQSILTQQNPYLFAGSVQWNVEFGLRLRGIRGSLLRNRARDALSTVGLAGFENRKTRNLSGGEQRRVAMARALAIGRPVLLLDEPTANLDREGKRQLGELIRKLCNNGTSIVLSTHDPDFGYAVCDDLITLQEGRILPPEYNIYKGDTSKTDPLFTRFYVAGGEIKCPAQAGVFHTAVLPFDDVLLSQNPVETSAQNQFKSRVVKVVQAGAKFRIELETEGGLPIFSFVTGYSVGQLGVRPGVVLFATFKASAVKLY